MFCHPLTGRPLDHKRYAATLRLALKRAKVDDYVRPFHDGRHTSITNSAAAGMSNAALMARAGTQTSPRRSSTSTWRGETFREEADMLDTRLEAAFGQKSGHK